MGRVINFLQLLERRVGVDFRCGELAVAQQLLHAFKPRTVVEHGGGEAVAEFMGVGTSRQAGFLKNLLDGFGNPPAGNWPAELI